MAYIPKGFDAILPFGFDPAALDALGAPAGFVAGFAVGVLAFGLEAALMAFFVDVVVGGLMLLLVFGADPATLPGVLVGTTDLGAGAFLAGALAGALGLPPGACGKIFDASICFLGLGPEDSMFLVGRENAALPPAEVELRPKGFPAVPNLAPGAFV